MLEDQGTKVGIIMECLKPDINILVNWAAQSPGVYDLVQNHLSSQKLVLKYSLMFLLHNCSNRVLLILNLKSSMSLK